MRELILRTAMLVGVAIEMLLWGVLVYLLVIEGSQTGDLGTDIFFMILFGLSGLSAGWVHFKKSGLRIGSKPQTQQLLDVEVLLREYRKSSRVPFLPRAGNLIFGIYNAFFFFIILDEQLRLYRNDVEVMLLQEVVVWTIFAISFFVWVFILIGGLVRHVRYG